MILESISHQELQTLKQFSFMKDTSSQYWLQILWELDTVLLMVWRRMRCTQFISSYSWQMRYTCPLLWRVNPVHFHLQSSPAGYSTIDGFCKCRTNFVLRGTLKLDYGYACIKYNLVHTNYRYKKEHRLINWVFMLTTKAKSDLLLIWWVTIQSFLTILCYN